MTVTLTHKKKQRDGSYVEVSTEYTTVKERVKAFHGERNGTQIHVETWPVSEDDNFVTMGAKVTTPAGTFTGHARSNKRASHIEGESPLEVAETSAVGRALAFAGYGIDESIASADEVKAAKLHTTPKPSPTGAPKADTPTNAALRKLYAVAKEKGMDEGGLKGFLQTDSLKALALHMVGPKGDCDMPHPHGLKDEAEGYRTMLRWLEAA